MSEGRFHPHTTTCYILLGAALLLVTVEKVWRQRGINQDSASTRRCEVTLFYKI
jgi:hypothetical protein